MGLTPARWRDADKMADMDLDLGADVVTLTEQLVNIESVTHDEAGDRRRRRGGAARPAAPRPSPGAATPSSPAPTLGLGERVVIAGHLDTVPLNDNLPARREGGILHGLGTCDMKGGDAVMLKLAADVTEPNRDLTFIFYEAEEVDSVHNGLRKLTESDPDLLQADFAILMEPSNASVEAGCQGTMRVDVRTTGERAHSARSWKGVNAIHLAGAGPRAAQRLRRRAQPEIDGLTYHEGLNATGIRGGVAGNVIPDECVVEVNFRFAPDRSEDDAEAFVRDFFEGYDVTVTDLAAGAMPGLDRPAAKAFVEAVGGEVAPKFGWTDVAQFTKLGVPAVNFGPGDPMFAHKQDEHVPIEHIERCERTLKEWLA